MDDTKIMDVAEPPLPAPPGIETAGGEDAEALPRPRTRWAAIIWGLFLGGVATAGLWILLEPSRRAGIADWVVGLSPVSMAAYAVLVIGGLALVAGIVGLARRTQRRLAHRAFSPTGSR